MRWSQAGLCCGEWGQGRIVHRVLTNLAQCEKRGLVCEYVKSRRGGPRIRRRESHDRLMIHADRLQHPHLLPCASF